MHLLHRHKKITYLISLILVTVFVSGLFHTDSIAAQSDDNVKVVRVAYYNAGEFQSGASEKGIKTGYAYEYLRKLASVTGWRYEYVYGDWNSCYQALINGDADLMAGMVYTEDRDELMRFPKQPMGYEKYALYRLNGSTEITDNPNSMKGKKIGALYGAMNDCIEKWMKESNINAEIVQFDSIEARNEALRKGSIQAFIGESKNYSNEFEEILTMNSLSFYCVTNRNRQDLFYELNRAQNIIFTATPYYINYLQEKYFNMHPVSEAVSAENQKWFGEHDCLNVGYFDNYLPYSSTDDSGEVTGIVKDIIPEMLKTGRIQDKLTINYFAYDDYSQMFEDMHAGKIDVIFPVDSDLGFGEDYGVFQTTSLLNSNLNMVYRGEYSLLKIKRISAVKNNLPFVEYCRRNYPDAEIVYFDSIEECIDAVDDGQCDVTFLAGLRTPALISNADKSELHHIRCATSFNVSFAVCDRNAVLLRILNACIDNLDENYALELTYQYTEQLYTRSVTSFFKEHVLLVLMIFTTLFLAIALAFFIFLWSERRERRSDIKLREQYSIVKSLSQDFVNIYTIDIEKKLVAIIKQEGFAIDGYDIVKSEHYPLDEMVRKYVYQRVSDKDQAAVIDAFRLENIIRNTENGGELIGTYRVSKGDKEQYYQYKFVRTDDNKLILAGFQNIDAVIEEQKNQKDRLEKALMEAQNANMAKSRFLFNMSHDIRTPMNAIVGYTELMKKNRLDSEKFEKYYENVSGAENFLLNLLNSVLDSARIESGQVELDESPSELILDEVVIESMSSEIEAKHLTVNYKADVTHTSIYQDETKVEQILLNILSNAVKYTPEGGTIYYYVSEEPGETDDQIYYKTVIRDTGIGISEEFLPHIFELFTREKNSTDNRIAGTGLGMGIVKQLVDLMHGTISVESELGKGTTVTLVIPHKICTINALSTPSKVQTNGDFAGKRILLAEDNDLNAEIAEELLGETGAAIERAEDGVICLDMLNRHEADYYDMILMDVQMPNMDGINATRQIRQLEDKQKAAIPIIAMTANAFEEDKRHCMDAGMNGFLSKPVDIARMIDEMGRFLK